MSYPYRGAYRYRPRPFRSRYRRRAGNRDKAAVAVAVVFLAAGGTVKAVVPHGHAHALVRKQQAQQPVQAAAVSGPGEAAFFTAVLSDLGAPATAANLGSLPPWAAHEGPWGSVGQWNPLDSTLTEPGSWNFNVIAGCACAVQDYPDASEGAQATAVTIEGFPMITAALRAGDGVCGGDFAGEFSRWSGGGYDEVC